MKLAELQIENYGIFRDRRLCFGGGFQLIHGPNEAGKSTLLMLLRELFFGFADRNPYAFDDHAGKMAATATVTTAAGRSARFCRQKKRKDAVKGEFLDTGEPLNEAGLTRLLDGASRNTFESLFAFSLADLAAGQEGLLGAAAQDALFGSGAGGLKRLHALQQSIDTQLEALFKPRAKNPAINGLLDRLDACGEEIEQSIIKPAHYEDLCRGRDELAAEEKRIREELAAGGRARDRLARRAKALPVWKNLALAEAELAEIDAPDGLPESLGGDCDAARQARDQAADDLRDAREKLEACERELALVRLRPDVLEREVEIDAAFREAAAMRACREALPGQESAARRLRTRVEQALADLCAAWTLKDLGRLGIDAALRLRVERMAEKDRQHAQQRRDLETRRKDHLTAMERDRRQIAEFEAIRPAPQLEAILAREGQYRADRETIAEGGLQTRQARQRIERLWAKLSAHVSVTEELLAAATPPFASLVEPLRDRFERSEGAVLDARGRLETARADLRRCEAELRQLAARESIPDRRQLVERRQHRDAAWGLIRRQYIEGQDAAAEAEALLGGSGEPLPDAFERAIEAADRLADERQEKAELVARHDQLAAEIAAKEAALDDIEALLHEREAAWDALQVEWQSLWSPLGIAPLAPRAMLEWLDTHRQWQEARSAGDALDAKLAAAQERIAAFEQELRETLGEEGDGESLLPLARRRVAETAEATSQRKLLAQGLAEGQRQLDQIDADLAALQPQQAQWEDQWRALLETLGFPADWDAPTVEKILAGLSEIRRDFAEVQRLEAEAAQGKAALAAYAERLGQLEPLHGDAQRAALPEDAAETLQRALNEARQARERHTLLSRQIDELRGRAEAKDRMLHDAAARIAACHERAGAADEDTFRRILAAAARRRRLQTEIEAASGELRRLAEDEPLSAFTESLCEADAAQLAAEADAARERCDALAAAYRQAISAAALMDQQVRDLDRTGRTPELVQHREDLRARLREKVGDYAVLKIAATVLRESLMRFEKEHQPAILADAGAMLARMTHGRYALIRTRLDERGSLEVEDAQGGAKTPDQLSTGTREQLHLALRLAHAAHYCRGLEPLPLVMDDVLVNFDDARAQGTLELLGELSGRTQILFLTCHETTVARIAKAIPAATVLDLAGGS